MVILTRPANSILSRMMARRALKFLWADDCVEMRQVDGLGEALDELGAGLVEASLDKLEEVDDADVLGVEEVRPEGNCASLRDMEICDDVIFPFRYCGVAIESTPIEHSTIALGQWTKPMTRMCWKWKRYNTR